MNTVAVVIPIYQADLTPNERISLAQCIRILGSHPICIVKPVSLAIDSLLADYLTVRTETFDDAYFQTVHTYNQLLCADHFYERFAAYDYMLIYQLDAFVMRDELLNWCDRGYDFIGAPRKGVGLPPTGQSASVRTLTTRFLQRPLLNGGLSLRRVAACRRLLRLYHRFFRPWAGNEDSFFSLHFPRLLLFRPFMRLPSIREALLFAFEVSPRQGLLVTQGQLPMGVHAWDKYDLAFWRPILAEHGYEV